MNRLTLSAVSAAVLAATAIGQQDFTVPSKATIAAPGSTWNDRASQVFVLWGTTSSTSQGSRVQYLYDVSDIPVSTANITALRYRFPHTSSVSTAITYTTKILMSVGPNTSTSASTNFANNWSGTNVATVFNGPINVPVTNRPPAWPAPWQAPLVFSQPYPFQASAGQSLVVDFETTAASQPRITSIEGYRLEGGNATFEFVDRDCQNSSGRTSGGFGWSPTTLIPGGSLTLSISGAPGNTPSYSLNAINFSAFGLGSQFGPFTTPFALSAAGLTANPNCDWAIGPFVNSITGNYRSFSSTSGSVSLPSPVPIPNQPAVVGSSFYTQCIGVDTLNGQPSLFPLTAIKHTIGTGNTIPAAHVRRTFDPAAGSPTTGSVRPSEAATLNLIY